MKYKDYLNKNLAEYEIISDEYENKNFKKVRESIAKAINGVYISKNAVFL